MLSREKDLLHLPVLAVISIFPQVARLCQTCQIYKTSKTETKLLGSPLRKVWMLDLQTKTFPPLGEAGSWRVSPDHMAVLGTGTPVWGGPKFLYQLLWVWLCVCSGYSSLSISFGLLTKGICKLLLHGVYGEKACPRPSTSPSCLCYTHLTHLFLNTF